MKTNMNDMMDFEFFAEKRLIFDKPHGGNGPKKRVKAPSESPAKTADRLRRLSEEIGAEDFSGKPRQPKDPKEKPKPRPRTHSGPALTRTLTDSRRPQYKPPENLDRAVRLEGQMDANETKDMQNVNIAVYKQYISPAFLIYVEQTQTPERRDKIFRDLNLIIERPDDFLYITKSDGTVHIVKRSSHVGVTSGQMPSFAIVKPPGHVVEIAGINLESGGRVTWMDSNTFNRNTSLYFERFQSDLRDYIKPLLSQQKHPLSQDEKDKIKRETFDQVTGPMKDVRETMQIRVPQRLAELIRKRNFTFERNDKQVDDFLKAQARQGTTYESLIDNWHVGVGADPKLPGLYQIYTENYKENPLVINYAGYVMRPLPDGSWEPDKRYGEVIRRKYYLGANRQVHQKAWEHGGLTADEKRTMTEREPNGKVAKEAQALANRIHQYRVQREQVDQEYKSYCKRAPRSPAQRRAFIAQRQKLREVAKAVAREPNENPRVTARRNAIIDKIKDPRILKRNIDKLLDREYQKIQEPNWAHPKLDDAKRELGI